MKKLLNTLYVTTEGAYLRKDGETVAIEIDGSVKARAPAHLLSQIVCFGQVAVSPQLLGFASEAGISVAWLGYSGKLLARIEGPQTGNVLLRRSQHEATKVENALPVARAVVAAKVANQRSVLRRHLRDNSDAAGAEAVDDAQRRLSDAARHALDAADLDSLRGHEGEAANAYWSVFPHIIRNTDPIFAFQGRNRRPPPAARFRERDLVLSLCPHCSGRTRRLRESRPRSANGVPAPGSPRPDVSGPRSDGRNARAACRPHLSQPRQPSASLRLQLSH